MKKQLWLSVIMLAFVACERSSDTPVGIPNVVVDCQESGCNSSLNGDTVFVIVTRSGCGESVDYDPIVTGSASVSCTSSGCSGAVTSWTDANNSVATEIISGFHEICAYIDADGSTSQNTGDMVSEASENITSSETITLDSWSTEN